MSILKDLEVLTPALATAGFRLVESESGIMDSGYAEFSDGTTTVRIGKDRSQWMLKGSRETLEPLGLWKAFDDTLEFREALLVYLKKRYA